MPLGGRKSCEGGRVSTERSPLAGGAVGQDTGNFEASEESAVTGLQGANQRENDTIVVDWHSPARQAHPLG